MRVLAAFATFWLAGAIFIVTANAIFQFDAMSMAFAIVTIFAAGNIIGRMWS